MTRDEKRFAATAAQVLETKIREIRPQLIDAATRGLCQVDRSHVAADVDEWLAQGPAVVRRAHEACWAAAEELSLAERALADQLYQEGGGHG